jgi:hypothetical protein
MALYGSKRDINFYKTINYELLSDVIEQKIGYYKIILEETVSNVYNESLNKSFANPILIDCMIDHSQQETVNESNLVTVARPIVISFLKEHLLEANIYPQRGDILVWNDDYFEVDGIVKNQFIMGKDSDYNYDANYLDNFGENFSVRVNCRYVSAEKLNLRQERI